MTLRITAYTPDLMDRSKISSAATAGGHELSYVRNPEALVGLAGVDLVIVDLSKRGVLEVLPSVAASGTRVIAYGSHVSLPDVDAPVEVLARSKFFGNLPALLQA